MQALFWALVAINVIHAAEQAATYFLDLTPGAAKEAIPDARPLPPEERLEMPVVVLSHADLLPSPDLAVRLEPFDAASYRAGDPYVVQLTIQNSGSAPRELPTSADNTRIATNDRGAVVLNVAMKYDDEVLGPNVLTTVTLYGATAKPGSTITLKPGESVRIRTRSVWRALARRRDPGVWTERTVPVEASVELRAGRMYAPVLSYNQVPVIFRSK